MKPYSVKMTSMCRNLGSRDTKNSTLPAFFRSSVILFCLSWRTAVLHPCSKPDIHQWPGKTTNQQETGLKGIMCKQETCLRRPLKPFHTYNVWSHTYRKSHQIMFQGGKRSTLRCTPGPGAHGGGSSAWTCDNSRGDGVNRWTFLVRIRFDGKLISALDQISR